MTLIYKGFKIDYTFDFLNKEKNLLLLHGWGGDKNSFLFIKNCLKIRFNIIAISFPPYFMKSKKSHIPITMHDYLNIILTILKLHNIKNVNIICHSFGFRLALMLSSTDIKIDSLIITGGAGINLSPNLFKQISLNSKIIDNLIRLKNGLSLHQSDYTILDNIDKKTFKNIINFDTTNYLKFNCPTLLFWGKKDTATRIKLARYINKKIKSSKLIVVDSDHFAYLNFKNLFLSSCLKFYKEIYD